MTGSGPPSGPADTHPAGTTVVVVGAGSGIGRGVATHLAERGARVFCIDRDLAPLEETVAAHPDAMRAGVADVTDPETVAAAFTEAVDAFGQVHAVINTAGIQGPLGKRAHEVDLAGFDATVAVNLRGALIVSQVAIRHMLEHGYGRIAHVASIAGKEGNPNMVAYSATKAGIIGMVKSLGKEYARDGITVNAVAPAVIQTPFLDTQPVETLEYMTAKIPMGRTGTIRECATMLTWMISPDCGFTTGAVFDLSGGRATY